MAQIVPFSNLTFNLGRFIKKGEVACYLELDQTGNQVVVK